MDVLRSRPPAVAAADTGALPESPVDACDASRGFEPPQRPRLAWQEAEGALHGFARWGDKARDNEQRFLLILASIHSMTRADGPQASILSNTRWWNALRYHVLDVAGGDPNAVSEALSMAIPQVYALWRRFGDGAVPNAALFSDPDAATGVRANEGLRAMGDILERCAARAGSVHPYRLGPVCLAAGAALLAALTGNLGLVRPAFVALGRAGYSAQVSSSGIETANALAAALREHQPGISEYEANAGWPGAERRGTLALARSLVQVLPRVPWAADTYPLESEAGKDISIEFEAYRTQWATWFDRLTSVLDGGASDSPALKDMLEVTTRMERITWKMVEGFGRFLAATEDSPGERRRFDYNTVLSRVAVQAGEPCLLLRNAILEHLGHMLTRALRSTRHEEERERARLAPQVGRPCSPGANAASAAPGTPPADDPVRDVQRASTAQARRPRHRHRRLPGPPGPEPAEAQPVNISDLADAITRGNARAGVDQEADVRQEFGRRLGAWQSGDRPLAHNRAGWDRVCALFNCTFAEIRNNEDRTVALKWFTQSRSPVRFRAQRHNYPVFEIDVNGNGNDARRLFVARRPEGWELLALTDHLREHNRYLAALRRQGVID